MEKGKFILAEKTEILCESGKEIFRLDIENRSGKIIIEKYKKLNKYYRTSNLTDQTHISSFLKDF